MIQNKSKKKFYNKLLVVLLTTFLVALCIIMPISYAKYITSTSSAGHATISSFIVDSHYNEEHTVDLSDFKPGDSRSYIYEIYNYSDTKTCEVKMSYSIELTSFNILPLTLTIEPVNDLEQYADKNSSNPLLYENGIFVPSVKEMHSYKITISWDEALNDVKYVDEIDAVKIIVIAQQVLA